MLTWQVALLQIASAFKHSKTLTIKKKGGVQRVVSAPWYKLNCKLGVWHKFSNQYTRK